MGMNPSSDYFNLATRMLEEEDQKYNIKIVDDVARGSGTVAGIKE